MATLTDSERVANRKATIERQQSWRAIRVIAVRQMIFDFLSPDGVCNQCGDAVDINMSDIDHIDPLTKTFHFSRDGVLFRKLNEVFREADKCQVLCKPCHVVKSKTDTPVKRGQKPSQCYQCVTEQRHAHHDSGDINQRDIDLFRPGGALASPVHYSAERNFQ